MTSSHAVQEAEENRVIAKATLAAQACLSLTRKDLAAILRTSEPTVSRMSAGKFGKAVRENALLFLRIYRSLNAILAGNDRNARGWLMAPNKHLDQVPLNLMTANMDGMVKVANYLDAMRGKL